MEKYLNEAIIGNKKILATYTTKGELQRMYYPAKDNRQYIEFFNTNPTGAFPSPIAPLVYSYVILNSTQDTFQISTDGITPINITNTGTGTFYAIAY